MRRPGISIALLLSLSVWTPLSSRADEPAEDVGSDSSSEPGTRAEAAPVRFAYRPIVDVPVTLLAASVTLGPVLFDRELPGPTRGDPADVFVLDRFVARSPEQRASARITSDVVLFSSLALGAAASLGSVSGEGRTRRERVRERLRRLAIFVESIASTNVATTVVKLAARRPRPFTYDAGYDGASGRFDDQLSYFSGHAATVAAASTTAAYFAFADRAPRARRYAIVSVGSVATLGVATLRVRAGKHFPTDVSTGILVGVSLGALVPHLHRTRGLALDVSSLPGGALVRIGGAIRL